MKFLKIILTLLCCAFFNIVNGQTKKSCNGFGFEIGEGYNTLKIISEFNSPYNYEKTIYKRNSFWIQPAYKIYYSFNFKSQINYKIIPFIGYYSFGGKSKTEANGYKDKYTFNSIEAGIIPTFVIKSKFEVAPSVKAQYILSVKGKYYGDKNQADSIVKKWKEEDWSILYRKFAFNAGLRAKYKISKNFSIGIETWFGIIDLLPNDGIDYSISVTENNYRLIVGYEL